MANYGDRELVGYARRLRKNMTKAEIILWSRLKSRNIDGFKFRRQQPLFNYIVDFYCHDLKMIIEVDGEIHSFKQAIDYDSKRDNIFKINGFKVLRLSNAEVITELNSAINKIHRFIAECVSKNDDVTTPDGKNVNLSPSQGDHRG
jgi:very-short-patch-repair endonuclease